MGFGNAALLAGMLLGLIPIIIHLINKRRARLVRFSAIEFLLLSDKKLARRLKIKQILVLALRVLLLVALAFALAKPYLEPDAVAGVDVSEPGAVALIIDDSASMNAVRPDGTTRLDEVLGEARRLVASRGERTSVAIIAAGAPARLLTRGVTFDEALLEEALGRITPGGRATDLPGALLEAGRVLSESGEARRQVLVLADQARHLWPPPPSSWSWAPFTDVAALPPKEPPSLPNLAVTGASISDDPAGRGYVLDATVRNFGPAEASVTVTLRHGDVKAAETLIVPAMGEATATFRGAERPERGDGTVAIEPSDDNRLADDDTWFFAGGERRALRVVLVNGAPRTPVWLDELFFARPAFAITPPGEAPVTATAIAPAELTTARLQTADVVVLANVGSLTREQALALTQWVERGGGLFIAAGDQLDPRTANQDYGPLLPFSLREVKSVGRANDPQSILQALVIATVDFDHPVFSIFRGLEDASLFKARVMSHVLIDTEGHPEARVLASFTGGIPAIVEAPLGRGRVMFWASSLDRDWTDLPLRTSFPPLLQRIGAWLGRLLDAAGGGAALSPEVGGSTRAVVPDGVGPVVVRRPDGTEVTVGPEELEGDTVGATVWLEDLDMAGHWRVMRATEPDRATTLAVNVPRAESDLAAADPMAIAATVDVVTRDNGVLPDFIPDAGEDTLSDASVPESARTVLWPWILAGLFLLFGSEAWLLIRS